MEPKRIQRQRTQGWRMPENTVYVGRPSRWGNKFVVDGKLTAREATQAFEVWLTNAFTPAERKSWLAPLRGKNLACWCKPGDPCHADVLLRWANEEREVVRDATG